MSTMKSVLAEVVHGAVVLSAVLAAILNIPGINVTLPAKDIAYLVVAGGIANAIVAALRPYASATASLIATAKATASGRTPPRSVPGR